MSSLTVTSAALALAALAGSSAVAWAQARPPARAPGPQPGAVRPGGLEWRLTLEGNLARGTVDRFLVSSGGALTITQPWWGLYLEPRAVVGEVGSRRTDEELYLRTVGFLRPRDRFFGFGLAVAEHSKRRQLAQRALAGAGVGANLLGEPDTTLLVSLGAFAEWSQFDTARFRDHPELTSRELNRVRATVRTSSAVRRGPWIARGDLYAHPAMPSISDLRVQARFSAEFAVAPRFSARVSIDYSYEAIVAVGTARHETQLLFGAAFSGP